MRKLIIASVILGSILGQSGWADPAITKDYLKTRKKNADKIIKSLQKKLDAVQKQKDALEEKQFNDSIKSPGRDEKCSGCIAQDKGGCTFDDFGPSLSAQDKATFVAALKKTKNDQGQELVDLSDANMKMNVLMHFAKGPNDSCQKIYDRYVNIEKDPGLKTLAEPCRSKVIACSKIGYSVQYAGFDETIAGLRYKLRTATARRDGAVDGLQAMAEGREVDRETLNKDLGPDDDTDSDTDSGTSSNPAY